MTQRSSDFWLRLIGIGLQSTLSVLTSELFWKPLSWQHLALAGFILARTTALWQINQAIIAWSRYRSSWRSRSGSRLAVAFLACYGATALCLWGFDLIWYLSRANLQLDSILDSRRIYLHFGSLILDMNTFTVELFHAFVYTIGYLAIYELFFYRQDSWRYQTELARLEAEREKLRVTNLESQLEVLKQQVNPHFLFNALNSLSALISEDPQQAEVFVDKLSGVYRYILRANSEPLTMLGTELDFIDAYFHLLQTRYGCGLRLRVLVDEAKRSHKLPPLTLQLLVENAVKHNVIAAKRPLDILIYTDESGLLVVQNNRQHKLTRALSNGVGLTNIVAKYQILNLPQLVIEETQHQFIVRLPLLASDTSAATDQINVG
ncbi:sensor histidine kinase [Fibrella forsythiae]|uniref:Histidine kinase n=1 Tax=Fibrella forsythiae TaxID=2817061 RepID=A0ABS3JSR4_9BACT|nr:histidine kinase [Fibrella forsythiae]MBO0953058.1 histidine kinase [Fibrella forsythiae]